MVGCHLKSAIFCLCHLLNPFWMAKSDPTVEHSIVRDHMAVIKYARDFWKKPQQPNELWVVPAVPGSFAHPVYRLHRAGSLPPPHSFYPHYNQSIWDHALAAAGHFVDWSTPLIWLKIGSWYPKWSWKDSGRGRNSLLMRAFMGSNSLSTSTCTVHGFPWFSSDPWKGASNG